MKHIWKGALIALAVILAVSLSAAALAAGNAGSADDPLVTLGYLNQVFAPKVSAAVDEAVAARQKALQAEFNEAIDRWSASVRDRTPSTAPQENDGALFHVVTLSEGQTLTGEVGCEVMLRIGSASCVSSSSPGLIDTTGGDTLDNGGALVTNHLYMITIETRGVKAASNVVKVLVRGSYTVS